MKMLDYVKLANVRMSENLDRAQLLTSPLVDEFRRAAKAALVLVASGSSRNASEAVRHFMEKTLGIAVRVVTPEAFAAYEAMAARDAFVVAITQSGYSTNTIAALDALRERGMRAIALTANVQAPVKDHADAVIDYGVGVESVDFVTMGVQALMEFLALFSLHAAHVCAHICNQELEAGMQGVRDAVAAHAQALALSESFVERERLHLARSAPTIFVGNGPNQGVIAEAALKFMETLKRPAMTFECEEFIHGPEMQMTPEHALFLVDDARGSARMAQLAAAFASVFPATRFITAHPTKASFELCVPEVSDPLLSAIPNLVPFQYIAAAMSEELDCWDVHPYLKRIDDALDAKAAGYDDALEALRRQASACYGEGK